MDKEMDLIMSELWSDPQLKKPLMKAEKLKKKVYGLRDRYNSWLEKFNEKRNNDNDRVLKEIMIKLQKIMDETGETSDEYWEIKKCKEAYFKRTGARLEC